MRDLVVLALFLGTCGSAVEGVLNLGRSLNVDGAASDMNVRSELYGVGLANVVTMNISLEGFAGTISSVDDDEDFEKEIDTMEILNKLGHNKQLFASYIVVEPPVGFNVSDIRLEEPAACAGASFQKYGGRYALPLAERPAGDWECASANLSITAKNPVEPLNHFESKWKVYIVSNESVEVEGDPTTGTQIVSGNWRGIFPLRAEVCGVLGKWQLGNASAEECPIELQSMEDIVRAHLVGSVANASHVTITCPGPSLTLAQFPLAKGVEARLIRERMAEAIEPLVAQLPVTSAALVAPAWTCQVLSDKPLMENSEKVFWWVVFGVAAFFLLVSLVLSYVVIMAEFKLCWQKMIAMVVVTLSLQCIIPVVVGLVFAVVILALFMGLMQLNRVIIDFLPNKQSADEPCVRYGANAINLLIGSPLKCALLVLRFAYDFIIMKAAAFM
eukprot:TRINITY_DN22092_c0_g1_i1.p2 TRINITY_DN22092_c0_g1~~TRINITY_DN22092_c0_g1_i1.p2  ORF type:complete len:444 (-),score=84.21 TRINITY_DN22092_c0_g1_i1:1597-2928(-)